MELVAVGAAPSSLNSICVAPGAPAVRTPAGKVMFVTPMVPGVSVKVFVAASHAHVVRETGFAPTFRLMALLAQFVAALVVKAPMFTVMVELGVKAEVQVSDTAGLVPDVALDGVAVRPVTASAG